MKNLNKIIFHIGGPKTGSTYIQKRLRNVTKQGIDCGLFYPAHSITKNMAGNAKILPVAIDKRATRTFKYAYPDVNINNLDPLAIMREFARGWDQTKETLVLSAENVRAHHATKLRELLPADANICIVLVVRNQIDWFESYYNQCVKTNETSKNISVFVDNLCTNQVPILLCPDWNVIYGAFLSAFGNCKVLSYDEEKSNIFESFCNVANIDSATSIPDIPRVQVSTPAVQTAYLLAIGSEMSRAEFSRHRAASTKAINCHEGKTMKFLSFEDKRKIRDNFQESNEQLMLKLGRRIPSLELNIETPTGEYCDLDELYQSQQYIHYKNQIKKYL